MRKPFFLALALAVLLSACGGLPLEELKTSEFRLVRNSQKPLWAYSQCLADHLRQLRGGRVVSHKLVLTVNVTRAGIELMSREADKESEALNYWYFVEVRPTNDGVRTFAWVCGCFNSPAPGELLARIDDAISLCGSVSV